MKKTTQTLLLVFSTLLLLVTVTVSACAQAPDFTGTWNTVTDKGKTIVITLEQNSRNYVTGYYLPIDGLTGSYQSSDSSINGFVKVSASTAGPVLQNAGSIKGRVTGNALRFTWIQDRGQGAGRLTLSSDGESFEGTFSATNNPDDTSGGTLNGTRRPSFAGAWQGKLGEGALELILQQAGSQVTGQVKVNSANLGVVREGRVVDNTLRFTVVRPGRPLPNGARSPDEVLGTGELVLDRGGRSFNGKILNADASGTLVGR
jgi:hypothetical protein